MRLLIAIVTLGCFQFTSASAQSTCRLVKAVETTRWGGNHWIASKETIVYRSIKGEVTLWVGGSSMEYALVEVFDQPDYLLCEFLPDNPNNCSTNPPANQRRLAACFSQKDGKFKLPELRAGNYELRVSKDISWNVFHAYIRVDPKKGANRLVRVKMTIGN